MPALVAPEYALANFFVLKPHHTHEQLERACDAYAANAPSLAPGLRVVVTAGSVDALIYLDSHHGADLRAENDALFEHACQQSTHTHTHTI